MSKTKQNDLVSNFLKPNLNSFTENFEGKNPTASSAFSNIFKDPKLTEKEQREIESILYEHQPGIKKETVVLNDLKDLISLTAEIKAINSQSIILHGERIQKAQNLLRDYKDGAFTKWLVSTYGNRQTPYSMLRYFEMYQEAPISHKAIIEAAPKKAVYLLASKDGDITKKLELLKNHGKEPQSDLILLIQETFPTAINDKRKPKSSSAIEALEVACQKLEKNKAYLSDDDRLNIKKLVQRLQKL